jgi:hypothetical protein
MHNALNGLVYGLLVVALIEAVQAAATHHLRRFGACALGGIGTAGAIAAFALGKRHKQLAAGAAAGHESLAHLMTGALVLLAVVVTVAAYIVVTLRARRRRSQFEPGRW